MTDDEGSGRAASTVSALMDERRRFEAWLAALDAKRASTPEHVFERVHLDYSTRLEAVVQQLTTHGDALRQEIESLTTRLAALRTEEQGATDERAEAELRAHVGELSAEAWSTTSAASDARLGELAGRRNVLESELARTTELLNETQRPATPPIAAASFAAASIEAPAASEAPVAARASGPALVSDSAEAAMHVPVAAPAPRTSSAQPAAEPADQHRLAIEDSPRSPTPPRASSFDELAFLSSVVDTPTGSLDSGPRDEPDEDTRVQKFARNSVEDAAVSPVDKMTPPRQLAAIEIIRDEEPPVPVSASTESGKTLKCGECGAMNYPTEWYCERCGAELASL